MNFKNINILTSKESWFVPYAKKLVKALNEKGYHSKLFVDHNEIKKTSDILFVLSYFKIIPEKYLKMNKHNLVVHESNLPEGKGWSPLFWQILENKKSIPIVLFEATKEMDSGNIYLKDYISLKGSELHNEIRKKQALKTIKLCLKFLKNYNNLKPIKQKGKSSFYKRRTPENSILDIDKSIKSQFNLLRIVNNKDFPAFFYNKGQKYILKIYKDRKKINSL